MGGETHSDPPHQVSEAGSNPRTSIGEFSQVLLPEISNARTTSIPGVNVKHLFKLHPKRGTIDKHMVATFWPNSSGRFVRWHILECNVASPTPLSVNFHCRIRCQTPGRLGGTETHWTAGWDCSNGVTPAFNSSKVLITNVPLGILSFVGGKIGTIRTGPNPAPGTRHSIAYLQIDRPCRRLLRRIDSDLDPRPTRSPSLHVHVVIVVGINSAPNGYLPEIIQTFCSLPFLLCP